MRRPGTNGGSRWTSNPRRPPRPEWLTRPGEKPIFWHKYLHAFTIRYRYAQASRTCDRARLNWRRAFKPESGGQAGADQAALRVARARGIASGGWAPLGRQPRMGRARGSPTSDWSSVP